MAIFEVDYTFLLCVTLPYYGVGGVCCVIDVRSLFRAFQDRHPLPKIACQPPPFKQARNAGRERGTETGQHTLDAHCVHVVYVQRTQTGTRRSAEERERASKESERRQVGRRTEDNRKRKYSHDVGLERFRHARAARHRPQAPLDRCMTTDGPVIQKWMVCAAPTTE